MKRAFTLTSAIVLTLSMSGVAASAAAAQSSNGTPKTGPSGDAFYNGKVPKHAKPGDIVWATKMKAPKGTTAWKVLYVSKGLDAKPVTVSGIVVAPTGKAPKGGRPVITWAHGTTGVADKCTQSKASNAAKALPFVNELTAAGDVVVATDYQGLGTPGRHPYLVGEVEGRGVLDMVRAANKIKAAGASKRTVIYGHSQGGHAALFAGQIAPKYAPDLHVLGDAAGAPVGDLKLLLGVASGIPAYLGLVVLGGEGFAAAYPEAKASLPQILTPQALKDAKVVDKDCEDGVGKVFNKPAAQVIAKNPAETPPWPALLTKNTPGYTKTKAPIFVFQGLADTLVPPFTTDAWNKRACALGDTIDYKQYPGQEHGPVLFAAKTDILSWIADRIAGKPAPNTCPA